MIPPAKIKFIADGNIAELVDVIEREGGKKLPEPKYVYKYIVSSTKLGLTVNFTEERLLYAYSNKVAEELQLS